ncbi:MAG TPA: phosphate acyltransferase [Candidatus Saccharimonadales bacterium]|nr:phosphate acyltransferase [Candidatus Saccharimonadales bacterium]
MSTPEKGLPAGRPASQRSPMDQLKVRAARRMARIVFPEGEDPRTVAAVERLSAEKLAQPTLLGDEAKIRAEARRQGFKLLGVKILDPAAGVTPERVQKFQLLLALADEGEARTRLGQPMQQAAFMVRQGEADAGVGGAVHTTAEVIRAGLKVVGLRPGVKTVSSFFLMELPGPPLRVLCYADCAVVAVPTPEQLADIAVSTADSFERLTGETPLTAFLAFSTKGSAQHEVLDNIRAALELARQRAPQRVFDGELQVDAALVPAIGERKAPGSPVAGRANVLIFPDLNSGNIGYKLTERLAGARALGPIVQGLARPFCDLSRGASADDIYNVAVVAAVLAGEP